MLLLVFIHPRWTTHCSFVLSVNDTASTFSLFHALLWSAATAANQFTLNSYNTAVSQHIEKNVDSIHSTWNHKKVNFTATVDAVDVFNAFDGFDVIVVSVMPNTNTMNEIRVQ